VYLISSLLEILLKKSEANIDVVIPGYTHMQKAQPVTLGHHFMAYFEMFKRDLERFMDCYKRTDIMPLGSGALAATTYPLDRLMVAVELGFGQITQNSIDGVADRDFAIEFINCCAILMMHLSRFCEEIIIWNTYEFGFVEMDDAYSTGSSIMPQKKNPDVAELIRGKSGRVYGDLMALLTVMKGLPLAYNKDLQEDKEITFDASDTVRNCLKIFAPMFETMIIKEENIKNKLKGGFLNATDVADYLVLKGISFRNAHEITGLLVNYCMKGGKEIEALQLDELKMFSPVFEKDIYACIDLEQCVNRRNITGGPARACVETAILNGRTYLQQLNIEKLTFSP
jgi:argininosuccinate lyase